MLTLRPRKTAAKYAAIWTDEGSPLMVNSRQQALLLRGYLGERGRDVEVALAMRYGEPSIRFTLDAAASKKRVIGCWCCRCIRSIRRRRPPRYSTR